MGIDIRWLGEAHSIILLDFKGKWTWEDLRSANEQADAMIKSAPHVVDMINDLTHSGGLPSGALSEARAMMNGFESGEGQMVVVQAGGLVQSLYSVFQKLYGRRAGFPETHFFDTREDALSYLREQRDTN
jgi:hypothetical protein